MKSEKKNVEEMLEKHYSAKLMEIVGKEPSKR